MNLNPRLCCFALLLLICVAQYTGLGQAVLHFEAAYAENRISENASRCMLMDSRGFLWIGTIDGLNRYDGRQFRIYQHDPRDSSSISGNYIVDIQEDEQGNIWVGTDAGINRYRPSIDGFEQFRQTTHDPGDVVRSHTTKIVAGPNGQLWVASYGGLARFNAVENRFEELPIHPEGRLDGLLHEDVTSIGCTANGNGLWIGYQDGRLSRYEHGRFVHYPGIGEHHAVTALLEDWQNRLWIGSSKGVHLFDKDRIQLSFRLDQECRDIYYMQDQIWFNINLDGIMMWDPTQQALKRVRVHVNNELVTGDIKAFFQDRTGTIWGTFHGLFKQDPYENRFKYQHYSPADVNGLSEPFVSGIAEDHLGNLVVLTVSKGLNYFDKVDRKWYNFSNHPWYDNDLMDKRASRLALAGDKAFVINHEAVFEFDLKTGTLRKFSIDKVTLGYRSSITVQSADSVWIGGKHIILLHPQTGQYSNCTPQTEEEDKKAEYIVFQDENRHIWAINDRSIYQLDHRGETFLKRYQFGQTSAPFGQTIIVVKRDYQGRFWIGRRNGLECFDPQTARSRHYSVSDGLPSNTVNSIEITRDGQLWLGTNKGLSRFDPEQERFRNYDPMDGVQDEIFLTNSSYQCPDGRLLFGGVNGFNIFHPDSLLGDNPHPPKLLITDLSIFNESIHPSPNGILTKPIMDTKFVELSYRDAAINFELLALGFTQPKKNEYAYMIEGFDPDWIYAGSGRTATYHGLPRGETLYFKAKAANHDGTWSEPIVLALYIRPPFWETGWFRLMLFSALLGTIFCYSRWRIRSIRQRNLWLEKEVKKQTAEIEHQAADLQIANEQLKLKAEIIREKARQLDQLNKAQARFFISLSHEFRTPLTLLLGNLEALLQAEKPELVFEKISRRMQMSAQQLLQLINQLMDTAKLESGQYRLRVNKGALKQEILGICSTFQVLAEKKQLELRLEFQNAGWQDAWYDSDILHKVLNNLLSNAVKFTEVGQIEIRADLLADEAAGNGRTLRLKVCDTGIGIPKEQLPFVFDRFFQAEGPMSARKKGTGIGLSLVKQLVDLHKGQIQIYSEKGKGTTFEVRLPIDRDHFSFAERPDVSLEKVFPGPPIQERLLAMKAEPLNTDVEEEQRELPLILVVDDNPEIRSFVVSQLKDQYTVKEAADGAEAKQLAVEHLPDLVVSDVVMPNLNGFELCDRLKTDQRTSHIPIILLTALAEQQQKLEGLKQGADAYLSKPFSREELLLRISNLIETREKLRRKFLREYSLDQLPDGLSSLDQNFLQRLQELVEQHLTDEAFGTEQMVKALGVSRTQLFRKLKALTGMSASEFVRDFRLRKAYQLLHRDDLTVSEVIYATGFNSRSYFYKAFKKKFGVVPSELKKV